MWVAGRASLRQERMEPKGLSLSQKYKPNLLGRQFFFHIYC